LAIGIVGESGQRRLQHGRIDRQRSDLERFHGLTTMAATSWAGDVVGGMTVNT
jgi:hypothetical protein